MNLYETNRSIILHEVVIKNLELKNNWYFQGQANRLIIRLNRLKAHRDHMVNEQITNEIIHNTKHA